MGLINLTDMLTSTIQLNYSSTEKLPWSPHAYHPLTPRADEGSTRNTHITTHTHIDL